MYYNNYELYSRKYMQSENETNQLASFTLSASLQVFFKSMPEIKDGGLNGAVQFLSQQAICYVTIINHHVRVCACMFCRYNHVDIIYVL